MPLVNRLSQETGIPLVATNDSHYLRKDDARAHEILLCIQTGKTMSRPEPDAVRPPSSSTSRSRDEMMKLFGELRGCARPHLGDRAALPRQAGEGQGAVPEIRRPARAHRSTPTSSTSRGRDSRSAARAWKRCARAGRSEARPRRVRRAPGSRNQDDPADEVLRLLPDRLGLHPLRASSTAFRWVRAAVRPPAAWSATRWRSPISIRCSTACCSSAS